MGDIVLLGGGGGGGGGGLGGGAAAVVAGAPGVVCCAKTDADRSSKQARTRPRERINPPHVDGLNPSSLEANKCRKDSRVNIENVNNGKELSAPTGRQFRERYIVLTRPEQFARPVPRQKMLRRCLMS